MRDSGVVRIFIALSAVLIATACSAPEKLFAFTSTPLATPVSTATVVMTPVSTVPPGTAPPTPVLTPTCPPAAVPNPSLSPEERAAGVGEWDYGGCPLPPLPPLPSQPGLPSGATSVASGTQGFMIQAGAAIRIEAQNLTVSAPPSAALVWTLAWSASDSLSAAWYRQVAIVDLGRGRWGTATLGGAGFELRNDGSTTVWVALRYLIGSR